MNPVMLILVVLVIVVLLGGGGYGWHTGLYNGQYFGGGLAVVLIVAVLLVFVLR